jgi:Family of unknown function (DUF5677)
VSTEGEGISRDFRQCGLALLDASDAYERALVPYEVGKPALVEVGLVARGRRLARSAFQLADAGDRLEAMILVRTLLEYRITLRWLILDPELHFLQMYRDDVRRRQRMDAEVRALGIEGVSDAVRAIHETELAQIEAELGDRPRGFPSLRERAEATGAEAAYSLLTVLTRRGRRTPACSHSSSCSNIVHATAALLCCPSRQAMAMSIPMW